MEHRCVSLVPLFNHLPEEEQAHIEALVHRRTFRKGETLYSPAEEPLLLIVAQGKLKVYQLTDSGREQLLRMVGPGDYEGENALFGAVNENIYVEAMEDTLACTLRKDDFTRLLLNQPALALKLLEINAQRAAALESQSRFLLMEEVEERLATYLMDVRQKEGFRQIFTIPMKWKDLAAYLGTTPETLSRKLKKWEQQGIIGREGKKLELKDEERLRTFCR